MKFTTIILALLVIPLLMSETVAQNSGYGLIFDSKFKIPETNTRKSSIAKWNNKLRENGNSTPNRFGVSVHSFFYNQDFYGTELRMVG